MFATRCYRENGSPGNYEKNKIERSDNNKQLLSGVKQQIVGAANSQEEVTNGRGPARAEEDRGRGQGTSGSRQVVSFPLRFSFLFSELLCWRVSIGESSSRREERASMEGLTPTQQQDEEQDNLVGGPGPTQRSSSGGRETGSVDEGRVHGNTLATVSASSSGSVQFPEVESQALNGAHRRSGRGGHGLRENTRTSRGTEGRGSFGYHRGQTNPTQRVPPPQHHQIFSRAESRAPPSAGGRSSYQQVAGAGRDYSQLAVFNGLSQAPWGPVGSPQHQRQGWTPQLQYDTRAQQQPQQGEAPQQQEAAMTGGGGYSSSSSSNSRIGQQLNADAPPQLQRQGWPTAAAIYGCTPQQPQQGWGPEQGGEGGVVRWGRSAVSPRQQQQQTSGQQQQQQSNWQQQQ